MNAKKDFQFKEVNEDRGYVRFSHSQKKYIYSIFFLENKEQGDTLCLCRSCVISSFRIIWSSVNPCYSMQFTNIQLSTQYLPTQVMLKYFSWHITYHAIAIIPTPIVLHFEEMKEQQCTVCVILNFFSLTSQYNIIYDIEQYNGWILLNVETMPKFLHYLGPDRLSL